MKLASRGARRALMTVALLSLTALTLAAGGSAAPEPEATGTEGIVSAVWTPMGLREGPTTVMVQLAGDPVTVVQSKRGDLSKGEKEALKAQLKAQQDGLHGRIAALGGSVLADFQLAYNGIKVRIDRKQLAELAQLPGVQAVRDVPPMTRDNVRGVPMIGTPAVWDGVEGLHGEGIKIAVLDTGIDYTHATFGGPGTTASFDAADAADTLPADSSHFGPAAPRIKGGIDLVGDDYNADPSSPNYQPVPHPDPNPLDCNGHGTHVAGTAAGSGVLSDGSMYEGDYDADTIEGNSWTVGPGVAPTADIYAVRVFGCAGSTDVTVEAIEWAVANDMDVINMSLGSPFGSNTDPSAEASTNAALAGVIVVASAGNSGPNQYITGSPASADGAISVAAIDPIQSSPGVEVSMTLGSSTTSVIAQNNNGATITDGTTMPIVVLRNPDGSVSFGCAGNGLDGSPGPGSPTEYEDANVAGKVVVVVRGVCARVARAVYAQKAGAAAVILINDTSAYPPFEGPITSNPDTGEEYTVTIPFLGVRGVLGPNPTADGDAVVAKDGGSATLSNTTITNTNFRGFASFSSGGPRTGDSALKPDITAPGVSITSAGVGSGNGPLTISGTSMAAPHVAGVAALTRQAHPAWSTADIKAAIVNTGDPGGFAAGFYRTSRGGTGLVQPQQSTATSVVATTAGGQGFDVAVNFGFAELATDLSETRTVNVKNNGDEAATFNISAAASAPSRPHSLSASVSSITVPAGGSTSFDVTLGVPAGSVGPSTPVTQTEPALAFREVVGLIELAATSGNNGVSLRVPYYLVPRSQASVDVTLSNVGRGAKKGATATVTNAADAQAGDADFYAWGLSDGNEAGNSSSDVRAIGVQQFPWSATEQLLVFAVNTHDRWSNAATNEYDIYVDVDEDKVDDYIVVGVDQGAVQTGTFNGKMASFVFSTRSSGASVFFFASDPTDSSTVLLPVLGRQFCRAGEPCLTSAQPKIRYRAVSFDLTDGGFDLVDGTAKYDAFTPVVGEGAYVEAAPGSTTEVQLDINDGVFNATKPLGVMAVSLDNASGASEAKLIPVTLK